MYKLMDTKVEFPDIAASISGWSDKPDKKGGISVKRRYKLPGLKFRDAEEALMEKDKAGGRAQTTIMSSFTTTSTSTKRGVVGNCGGSSPSKKVKTKTLHNYFQSK